jgi:hypothetical protein
MRVIAVIIPICLIVLGGALVRSSTSAVAQASYDQPVVRIPPPARVDIPARRPESGHAKRPPAFRIVHVSSWVRVARWPNGPTEGFLSAHTGLGSPTWLWVVSRSAAGRWLRVVLPWPPNGSTGWIRRRGQRVLTTMISLDADLSQREVRVMRRGRPILAVRSAIGAPASPTPAGRFSVTDRVSTGDPAGPFGWYAFGLSGHQQHLPPGWTGGDQLAIHGTNAPSSIGDAVSAGCLRVSAHALSIMRRYVRLGTPVVIHP